MSSISEFVSEGLNFLITDLIAVFPDDWEIVVDCKGLNYWYFEGMNSGASDFRPKYVVSLWLQSDFIDLDGELNSIFFF
jgi:hypothetical protein